MGNIAESTNANIITKRMFTNTSGVSYIESCS